MFWTLKGIRLSKPSRRASASRRGSAMVRVVMQPYPRSFCQHQTEPGWNASTPISEAARTAGLRPTGQPRAAVPTCLISTSPTFLHQALIQHGIGYFHKTCNVGAVDQVAGRAVFLRRFV